MNYSKLTEEQKRCFAMNLIQRRSAYEKWQHQNVIDEGRDILLIADRPGPAAPKTDDYHHTPFYAKTYSGGWLNACLVEANIPETRLFWENSADRHGNPRDPKILGIRPWFQILLLGNNAENWVRKNLEHVSLQDNGELRKFMHPQAHKRWSSAKPYNLIAWLQIPHTP